MTTCAELAPAIDDAALGATPSSELAAHITTCAACATELERRRELAQRIDRAVGAYVRAEPPPGIADRVAARVSTRRPQGLRRAWLGVPVAAALAAGFALFAFTPGGLHGTVRTTDVTALAAWRSPTAYLLVSTYRWSSK